MQPTRRGVGCHFVPVVTWLWPSGMDRHRFPRQLARLRIPAPRVRLKVVGAQRRGGAMRGIL